MSDTVINEAAGGQLRAYIERYERIEKEIVDLQEILKEILAELKGNGFDRTVFLKVIKARKKDASQLSEEEAIFDLYMSAVR